MGKMMSVNHATDNGMLPPDGTKPLPKPILTPQSAILQKMRDICLLGDNEFMCTVT